VSWTIIADTLKTDCAGLKVVLKKGEPEIFKVDSKIPRLAAQSTNYVDDNVNVLEVGFWDQKGEWTAIAKFSGGSWLYVRPLS